MAQTAVPLPLRLEFDGGAPSVVPIAEGEASLEGPITIAEGEIGALRAKIASKAAGARRTELFRMPPSGAGRTEAGGGEIVSVELAVDSVGWTCSDFDEIDVSMMISNTGLLNSGQFTYAWFASTDTTIDAGDYLIDAGIEAGLPGGLGGTYGSGPVQTTGVAPNDYIIIGWADVEGDVAEPNESNNFGAAMVLPFLPCGPDLRIQNYTTSCLGDGKLQAQLSIRNYGSMGAPANWDLGIYLSSDPGISTADQLVSAGPFPLALPARTDTNILTIESGGPAFPSPGFYFIGTLLDINSEVPEAVESNNGASGAFTYLPCVAPPKAVNPSPAHMSTGHGASVMLSWQGAGADSFGLYLGTSPALGIGQFIGHVSSPYPATGLSPATTYYWRIDPGNLNGTTTGDVWQFTTAAAPTATATRTPTATPSSTPTATPTAAPANDCNGNGIEDATEVSAVNKPDFASVSDMILLGSAGQSGSRLRLTCDGCTGQTAAAWHNKRKNVAAGFSTTFGFEIIGFGAHADGLAFVIQNAGPGAIGTSGSGMGYAGIANSLAVEFDTHGEENQVSVQSLGTAPNDFSPAASLGSVTAPFGFANSGFIPARVEYLAAPGLLRVYAGDLVTPILTVPVDLDALLNLSGGSAIVGFTSATGGLDSTHEIVLWTMTTTDTAPVGVPDVCQVTPTPSPTPGPTCCPGDANNSGSFVDANDFIAVQANFGADNGVGGLGDANCSGSFVDANDFIAVQANFGADCG